MRISDWSSDVCSSDRVVEQRSQRLLVHRRVLAQVQGGQVEAEAAHAPQHALQGEAPGLVAEVVGEAGIDGFEVGAELIAAGIRSEGRRVGKGCGRSGRSRRSPAHYHKNNNPTK